MRTILQPYLVADLLEAVSGDLFWEDYLRRIVSNGQAPYSLHLAVMVEPFLQFVLSGRKTVESRFSVNRCAPYGHVEKGDVILLKRTGGPIVGLCQVSNRWFYQLDPGSWNIIREKFTKALCADSADFWRERERASFATLMRVHHVRQISPVKVEKRDRRGWVVLRRAIDETTL
jgi:hypothetical protein